VRLPLLAAAVVLVLAAGLLRRRPLPALALLLAGSLAVTTGLDSRLAEIPQILVVDVAVCFIAATRPHRTSIVAAVMALVVLAGDATVQALPGFHVGTSSQVLALTTVIAWLIGNSIRQSHVHSEALRAQTAARAVTAERLRIARELHDMVAHSIGIIAIQAGVGSRVIDTQPSEARNSLTAIEATSRETLAGLRRTLGALRQAEPGPASEGVPFGPVPGLADVDRLAATTLDAGVRVDVQSPGQRPQLPADIDLAAFRIIQEAVTNVVTHAGTDHCQVTIDHRDGELFIDIIDGGRGGTVTGTGYGLVGMRERVGLLHGQLTAGPRPEGGFRVTARLPVPAAVR
jgi:signal transduction histidine kinase